jgi:putative glutamine amidotransferase
VTRPVIGVTAGIEPDVRWRVWEEAAALLPASYPRVIARAGGRPVLLPPDEHGVEESVAALDGLVLSGGNDLDPTLYGQAPHPLTRGMAPERDRAELALLRVALAEGLPVLGICRGGQLIAVAAGGSLHQHLPELVGHQGHQPEPGRYGRHPVRLDRASRTGAILGPLAEVASHHHQGIASVGTGLEAVAWAEDGTIEAVEATARGRFVVGVLWHPEEDGDERPFAALVDAAGALRAGRVGVTPG